MICRGCKSERVICVTAKCSDCCSVTLGENEHDGYYVPSDLEIGGGDYIDFSACLNCGLLQGTFPRPQTEIEGLYADEDLDDEIEE